MGSLALGGGLAGGGTGLAQGAPGWLGGPVVGLASELGAATVDSALGAGGGVLLGMTMCPGSGGGGGGGSAGSTGRTDPRSIKEQLAMEEVKSNPSKGIVLEDVTMSDKVHGWLASQGWVKMARNVEGVEIHWVRNTITGAVDDFKFAN